MLSWTQAGAQFRRRTASSGNGLSPDAAATGRSGGGASGTAMSVGDPSTEHSSSSGDGSVVVVAGVVVAAVVSTGGSVVAGADDADGSEVAVVSDVVGVLGGSVAPVAGDESAGSLATVVASVVASAVASVVTPDDAGGSVVASCAVGSSADPPHAPISNPAEARSATTRRVRTRRVWHLLGGLAGQFRKGSPVTPAAVAAGV